MIMTLTMTAYCCLFVDPFGSEHSPKGQEAGVAWRSATNPAA